MKVDRRESELRETPREAALAVDEPARLARSHGHAEDALLAERHQARERRHVAVVRHLDGHVPLFANPQEHRLRFGVALRRNRPEQRRHLHAVVHHHAGGAPADRVHVRQRFGGLFQAFVELAVVVFRIRLIARIPREFFAENHLAAPDRADLEIAGAEVEPQPTPVGAVVDQQLALVRLRHLGERPQLHCHRLPVDAFHKGGVKRSRAGLCVLLLDGEAQLARARQHEPPTAVGPQHKLDHPLGQPLHFRRVLGVVGQRQIIARHIAVLAFPGDRQNFSSRTRRLLQLLQHRDRRSEIALQRHFPLYARVQHIRLLTCPYTPVCHFLLPIRIDLQSLCFHSKGLRDSLAFIILLS